MAQIDDLINEIQTLIKALNVNNSNLSRGNYGGGSKRGSPLSTDDLVDRVFNRKELSVQNGGVTAENITKAIDATMKATYRGAAKKYDTPEKRKNVKDAIRKEGLDDLNIGLVRNARNQKKQLTQYSHGLAKIGATTNGAVGKMAAGASKALGKLAGPIGWVSAGVSAADKAFKACAEKAMAYQQLHTDQYIKTLGAETTAQVNSMKVSVTALKDAVQASSEAISASIESNFAQSKAIADNQLAQMKMNHTWTNWIPIVGTLNKLSEKRMELQNQAAEAEIQNAQKIVDMWVNATNQIDDSMKTMDESQRSYQRLIGIQSSQMGSFREGLYAAGEAVAAFGKSADDIIKARTAFTNESGRNIAWSQEDTTKALATGALVGDATMNSFAAGMVLFNTSVKDSAEIMENVYKDANKMGVSSQKLTKSVLSNLKQANKYNFKNGVEGFIKAAKWAETARYDMAALGSTLDKVQEGGLEGVLQQSAQLQVLGGNAAMGADPMKMMYNAYNDPEAFAKMQQDALKNFGHINSKTGETQFNMGDQMQIAAIAKAYGLSKDQAMEMARASNKRSAIAQANGSLSGEDLDAITNRAEYDKKTQEWKVKMLNGESRNISSLTAADIEQIAPEDNRTSEEIAKDTLSATEKIAAETARSNILLAKLGGFEEYLRHVDETTKITQEGNDANREKMIENGKEVHKQGEKSLEEQLKMFGEAKGFAAATNDIKDNTDILVMDKKARGKERRNERREIRKNLNEQIDEAKAIGATHKEIRELRRNKRKFMKNWRAKGRVGYSSDFINAQDFSTEEIEKIDDGLIIHNSGKVISFNNNDDIIAAKEGGAISKSIQSAKVVGGGMLGAMPPLRAMRGVMETIRDNRGVSNSDEISVKPIEINLNGTLNLSGGGNNVNIIDAFKNNQEFLRVLTQMITAEMSKTLNGGKSVAWNGRFGK